MRIKMYEDEMRRNVALEATLDYEEFINGLNLQIDIRLADENDLGRIAQLSVRTNQFNFSTRKWSEAELAAIVARDDADVRICRVKDRYGDYGLVGASIFAVDDSCLLLSGLYLSCRALGRGVEHAMLRDLGHAAHSHGRTSISIDIVPTERNIPARRFLREIGVIEHVELAEHLIASVTVDDIIDLDFEIGLKDTSVAEEKVAYPLQMRKPAPSPVAQEIFDRFTDVVKINDEIQKTRTVVRAPDESNSRSKTETERKIAQVWESLLGVQGILSSDTFFDLGGTSIQIPHMISELQRQHGLEATIVDVFQYPSVEALARRLSDSDAVAQKNPVTASEASKRKEKAAESAVDFKRARERLSHGRTNNRWGSR
jgi:hypothetical protein